MYIEHKHLQILKHILSKYQYKFYIFGSRANGNAKQLSDIDLCYFDSIPGNIIIEIETTFEDSDLPYKVDIVDANKCDPSFKEIIKRDAKAIQEIEDLISQNNFPPIKPE